MKRLIASLLVVMSVPLFAQQPKPPAAPQQPRPAPSQAAPSQPPEPPELPGQPVNIRLDVSIRDQVGTEPATPKTLMVLLADRSMNQIRATFDDRMVSIDTRPTIDNGHVRLRLSIVSDPRSSGSNEPLVRLRQSQSLTTILENGKPLVVMESVDPANNNRKMTIEVKATILK